MAGNEPAMVKPPAPKNEARRLEFLRSLNILDTGPEENFERITRLAQRVFGVAAVTLSLVDEDRVFFKSLQGLRFPAPSREASFTGHALNSDELLLVPDTREDKRFADNPLVMELPHFRFYAGSLIKGVVLVCVPGATCC